MYFCKLTACSNKKGIQIKSRGSQSKIGYEHSIYNTEFIENTATQMPHTKELS